MEVKNVKRILIAATLLLSLVGGAGQASADPGSTPRHSGVTWDGGAFHSLGITWE